MKLYIYLMLRNTGKKAQLGSVARGDNFELIGEQGGRPCSSE